MVRKLLKMEREMGLEPTTSSLGSWHPTAELLPLSSVPELSTWVRSLTVAPRFSAVGRIAGFMGHFPAPSPGSPDQGALRLQAEVEGEVRPNLPGVLDVHLRVGVAVLALHVLPGLGNGELLDVQHPLAILGVLLDGSCPTAIRREPPRNNRLAPDCPPRAAP